MGQISTIQSDVFFDFEGLDTLTTIPSQQEEGSFEGYFSGAEHSFKKKSDLRNKDTDVLDPGLLYSAPRPILSEVNTSFSIEEKQSASLEIILPKETNPLPSRSSFDCVASPYQPPAAYIQNPDLMPGLIGTKGLVLVPEASSLKENSQVLVENLGQSSPPITEAPPLETPMSALKRGATDGKANILRLAQSHEPKKFLEPTLSTLSEKRVSPSVFSNNKDFEINPDKTIFGQARLLSENKADHLAIPVPEVALGQNLKDAALNGPLKPVLSSPLASTVSTSYTGKDKLTKLPNPTEGQSSAFLKSVSTSFSPYHRSDQTIALGASLKSIPASGPNVEEVLHEESESKASGARSKTPPFHEYASPASFTQPPLDIQEANAILHHEKIQTDLVGLIADYFDKMKEDGRSWTRLSLHLGQDKKMQLLLRLQGDAVGLRLHDAPPGIGELLLKDWPHLSKIASQKGFRLQNPSFLGSASYSEEAPTVTL